MPSPFPGMDPYLEQYWGDVHTRLALYACDEIQGRLPKDLRARVEERVFVDFPAERERNVYPDVRIVQRGRGGALMAVAGPVISAQPLIMDVDKDPEDEAITERYIEIIDIGSGRQVVTVIEVLSPANKRPGPGQAKYRQKQAELLGGNVSLVEIDLLRAGKSVVSIPVRRLPESHRTPCLVVARRAWKMAKAEIYALPLRERLPTIKIPLREKDADVSLDLQAVLDRAYDNGAYADDLDYDADPVPALAEEDAAWADALLRETGLRRRPATKRRPKRKT